MEMSNEQRAAEVMRNSATTFIPSIYGFREHARALAEHTPPLLIPDDCTAVPNEILKVAADLLEDGDFIETAKYIRDLIQETT